ncbi:hypothetical protein [Methylophilus sp. DW102]|uniref:hypothetical protein n=1 Tax=Methylophilus sp. DW102 TaxID=3095607 RepID=UPI00308DC737|nr:hypothetical protein MTDW_12660 [Methylophilus sp. DW102]BEV09305.1 hypothetical protein MTDW_26050 [Methylophilus sp. DW102]
METKIVHNYSPEAPHIYLGSQVCYKTSLDPDTWQWTGSALENAPPATGENNIAAANADFTDWVVIANYVGFKYWLADGSEYEITEYGVSPPADALTEKPVQYKPPKTVFTSLEFLDKFTESEQLAVVEATMTNAAVKLWYDRLLAASFLDLADIRIPDGLNALVSAGLLEASRVAEIMTPEVQN